MIKIDLRTKKKRSLKETLEARLTILDLLKNKELIVGIVGGVIIFIQIVYILFLSYQENKLSSKKEYLLEEKRRLAVIERKLKNLNREIRKQKKIKENLNLKLSILEELNKRRGDIKNVLVNVGASIPEGIWIEDLTISKSGINLNGYTFNPDNIYEFFVNLKKKYPSLYLSTLGKSRFCNIKGKKDFVLCVGKQKKRKAGRIDYYVFSLNLKNFSNKEKQSDKRRD